MIVQAETLHLLIILNKKVVEDFLGKNYSVISHGIEILAAVIGLFFYKKYKGTAAKFFICFLCFIVLCDFIGSYTKYVHNNGFFNFLQGTVWENNYWWSTLYWKIGAILFFSFYYQKILTTLLYKRILKYGTFIFSIISIVQIVTDLEGFFNQFFPSISILGSIIIMLCVFFYFIEVLLSENILTFYKSLNFYISVAIFLWWLIITPLVFYDIYNSTADWTFVILKWQIYLFANFFMYSMFTFGLIFSEPENNKTLND